MDDQTLRNAEDELRERFPGSFTHPDLQEGEMVTESIVEGVDQYATPESYRKVGVMSVRLGSPERRPVIFGTRGKSSTEFVNYYPVIVNVREWLLAGYNLKSQGVN